MAGNLNLENSIWPNGISVDSEGYTIFYPLGTNKIDVPISSWPKGDKLISPFIYKNDKIVGLCDTKAMKVDKDTVIALPYEYIDVDFSSIEKGSLQIHAPNATTKKVTWANKDKEDIADAEFKYKNCKTIDDILNVESDYKNIDIINGEWNELLSDLEVGNYDTSYDAGMFYNSNLAIFNSDLNSLEDGRNMFFKCEKIKKFDANLKSLIKGTHMFSHCTNLRTVNVDLSSLNSGSYMFYDCLNLRNFKGNLKNIISGYSMFYNTRLASFDEDLSTLEDGQMMFWNCYKLSSFKSSLSSLTNGIHMFYSCTLDTKSIQNIAETINTPSSTGTIDIGIKNIKPNRKEIEAFNTIVSKNWIVYVNGNNYNSSSINTIDENNSQKISLTPYYAKCISANKDNAHYIDTNGNYFNIVGGQFIYGDDLSTYGIFSCEEDAAINMHLTKIERH